MLDDLSVREARRYVILARRELFLAKIKLWLAKYDHQVIVVKIWFVKKAIFVVDAWNGYGALKVFRRNPKDVR